MLLAAKAAILERGGDEAVPTQNVCKFIPAKQYDEAINPINFVYETDPSFMKDLELRAFHIMYLVTEGNGVLHLPHRSFRIKQGDLFFTFPATPFRIESTDHLTYLYISFIGIRGSMILDNLQLHKDCILEDYAFLIPFWMNALKTASQNNVSLLAESVLLYTFAHIARDRAKEEKLTAASETVLIVKKYIDDHFSDPSLSLGTICDHLSYNSKYISNAFKKQMGVGLNEYMRTTRIRQACALMERGFTCIGEIALFCGYSDPLYFSKSFKRTVGTTPREYLTAPHETADAAAQRK